MAFASADDVAARLGRALSTDESSRADALLDQVAEAIAGACGKDADWIDDLDPVPLALKTTSIAVALRDFVNPVGVRSETLGQYATTYEPTTDGELGLTEAERLAVRRAVFGSTTTSSRVPSALDDLDEVDPSSIGDRVWLPALGDLASDAGDDDLIDGGTPAL